MDLNYFGALNTARAMAKKMIEQDDDKPRRIVFISSTVGLMGMVGFAQYAPSKYALRGLADCLTQEFAKHRITFHVYHVASIATPGFESEQATKPNITKILEGSDVSGDQSAGTRARVLLDGLKDNQRDIASDFFTDLLLHCSLGVKMNIFSLPKVVLGALLFPIVNLYFTVMINHTDFDF